jgi:phosphotransferase system HPr (HPr) family protein
MKSCQTLIRNELGLHLRAAGSFVRLAAQFEAKITVATRTSPPVDGKSILGLATQGAAKGTELLLTADGPDEDEALRALVALVEDRFGEDK